ncbi:hypothetical protein JGU71_28190 [Antrihabitans sp. YC3-6]|uniref:Uncharacterized protein n=1 Tax=Antrihabitans stalagmiti TaxID=2799499 RepID=A0A934NWC6_9NOCA|nr:hypothetical protein [Antrihabitans stalagmiti]MBJ8342776.1 hypothetical protein [Antrihabitans stalagmiti]
MSVYRVTPAHDPSVQVEFEVPIKGRQNPIFFSVPKLQYLPTDKADEFEEWLKENKDGDAKSDRKMTLKLIEMLVPKHLDALSKLTSGELDDISNHWFEMSKVTVPES